MRADEIDKYNYDISDNDESALKNQGWEDFSRYYAGDLWGNPSGAYLAAGYTAKTTAVARANALRLLRKPEVTERIRQLRELRLIELEADRLWIAEQRKEIIRNAEKDIIKLHALKDLEKGLGLVPEKKRNSKANAVSGVKIVFNGREDGSK